MKELKRKNRKLTESAVRELQGCGVVCALIVINAFDN